MPRAHITIQYDPMRVDEGWASRLQVRIKRPTSDKKLEAVVDSEDETVCIAAALHLTLEELRKEDA